MTYRDVLENARKTILNCKACPECNGLACANTLPGPGSKAPGNGAHDNWAAWKRIWLNFDTFVEDGPVDTGCTLFGKRFTLPLMSGPIGSMTQYSREDVTVAFNDGVMEGTAGTGTIDCFGDGIAPETLSRALLVFVNIKPPISKHPKAKPFLLIPSYGKVLLNHLLLD